MATDLKRRPEWDEIHLIKSIFNAARSTCSRRNVGAELIADNGIDSVQGAYNGTPEGVANCNDGGCPRCSGDFPPGVGYELCICEHAEPNAYARAARRGVPTSGSTLYVTHTPCGTCLKMAVSHGTNRVVFLNDLGNEDPLRELLIASGRVNLEKYDGEMQAIDRARELVKTVYGREVY